MYKAILFFLLSVSTFSCSNGDSGAANCIEGESTLENVIPNNTWNYTTLASSGSIKFNFDGTYDDIQNTILDVGGTTQTRFWVIESSILTLSITSDNGSSGSLILNPKSVECNEIIFDGQGFGDISFTK